MSVNQRFGMDPDKTKHLGRNFSTIDFEVNPASRHNLKVKGEDAIAGKLLIGGKEFNCTLAELDRIIETCQLAKTVFWQKYRLGV